MKTNEPMFRHELKYVITDAELAMLKNRIDHLLTLDSHVKDGIYNIRSLYFDDCDNRCFYENENGTDPREKFRIRIYNASSERIMLECKRKERGKTLKSSCPLTAEQTRILMNGGHLRDISSLPPLLRRFTMEQMLRGLRPVVIVDYDRIPYVYKDGNVRVTLDTNISASSDVGSFLGANIRKRPVMPVGSQLLEVKYDEFLPDFIYNNLQLHSLTQTAFSKFYICRKFKI